MRPSIGRTDLPASAAPCPLLARPPSAHDRNERISGKLTARGAPEDVTMVADRHHSLALLGLLALSLFAGPAAAETVPWTASLSSKDVVPPTNSAGKGQLDA